MSDYYRDKGEKCKIHRFYEDDDANVLDLKMGDIVCMELRDREEWSYRVIYRTENEFIIRNKGHVEFIEIDTDISEQIEDPLDFYSTDELYATDLTICLCEKHQKIYQMEYLYHEHFESFLTGEEFKKHLKECEERNKRLT